MVGSAYIGDLAVFLGELGLARVWNGYGRGLENQADRMAILRLLNRGYDPRPAIRYFRIVIDRYGDRSTSALWSNHDSSVLRGSFLTVQLQRQYPAAQFAGSTVDTQAFQVMREAMGPVKVW